MPVWLGIFLCYKQVSSYTVLFQWIVCFSCKKPKQWAQLSKPHRALYEVSLCYKASECVLDGVPEKIKLVWAKPLRMRLAKLAGSNLHLISWGFARLQVSGSLYSQPVAGMQMNTEELSAFVIAWCMQSAWGWVGEGRGSWQAPLWRFVSFNFLFVFETS